MSMRRIFFLEKYNKYFGDRETTITKPSVKEVKNKK